MSKKKKQDKKLKAAANPLTKTQVDLTSNEFWTHFLSGGGSRVVTAEKSLSITAVWACVRFLAETISTLPLKVYRKLPDGSREEAKRHPLHNVLCVDPNKDQTPMKLMQFIVACISLGGNCRFEKKRNGNRLIALNPINPAQYRGIDKLDNGRYRYKFVDEKGVVKACMTKEEFLAAQGEQFLEERFEGSLPKFLAAFSRRKKLSDADVAELRKLIDEYEEE